MLDQIAKFVVWIVVIAAWAVMILSMYLALGGDDEEE